MLAETVDADSPSNPNSELDAHGPSPHPNRLSVSGWLSWIVIFAFTLFILGNTTLQQFATQPTSTEATLNDLLQVNLQAKMIVGQKQIETLAAGQKSKTADQDRIAGDNLADNSAPKALPDSQPNGNPSEIENAQRRPATTDSQDTGTADIATKTQTKQAEDLQRAALDTGSYEQRLCNAAIINEVEGPTESLKYLDSLQQKVAESKFERSNSQVQMESSVRQLLQHYRDGNLNSDIVDDEKQQQLRDRLGFCGELLLNPPGSKTPQRLKLTHQSQTTTIVAVVGLVMAILFFLFGIVSLLFIVTYVLTGSSPSQFQTSASDSNVYAETFALWLIAFFGIQMLFQYLEVLKTVDQQMIANPIFFFGSLLVLVWPVLRGVPVSRMLADIGWTPKHLVRNTFLSVPAYAAWLPAVLVGFFFVFVLMGIAPLPTTAGEFSVPSTPGHPIQQILTGGNALAWITIVIAACVAAPIVEETMFRGVLYRHLRSLTLKHGQTISILFSAVLNGVIFASLHPQGILAVPLLTTLAIGFSLVREWRDSLWTSILMHAFNNSMVTMALFFIL